MSRYDGPYLRRSSPFVHSHRCDYVVAPDRRTVCYRASSVSPPPPPSAQYRRESRPLGALHSWEVLDDALDSYGKYDRSYPKAYDMHPVDVGSSPPPGHYYDHHSDYGYYDSPSRSRERDHLTPAWQDVDRRQPRDAAAQPRLTLDKVEPRSLLGMMEPVTTSYGDEFTHEGVPQLQTTKSAVSEFQAGAFEEAIEKQAELGTYVEPRTRLKAQDTDATPQLASEDAFPPVTPTIEAGKPKRSPVRSLFGAMRNLRRRAHDKSHDTSAASDTSQGSTRRFGSRIGDRLRMRRFSPGRDSDTTPSPTRYGHVRPVRVEDVDASAADLLRGVIPQSATTRRVPSEPPRARPRLDATDPTPSFTIPKSLLKKLLPTECDIDAVYIPTPKAHEHDVAVPVSPAASSPASIRRGESTGDHYMSTESTVRSRYLMRYRQRHLRSQPYHIIDPVQSGTSSASATEKASAQPHLQHRQVGQSFLEGLSPVSYGGDFVIPTGAGIIDTADVSSPPTRGRPSKRRSEAELPSNIDLSRMISSKSIAASGPEFVQMMTALCSFDGDLTDKDPTSPTEGDLGHGESDSGSDDDVDVDGSPSAHKKAVEGTIITEKGGMHVKGVAQVGCGIINTDGITLDTPSIPLFGGTSSILASASRLDVVSDRSVPAIRLNVREPAASITHVLSRQYEPITPMVPGGDFQPDASSAAASPPLPHLQPPETLSLLSDFRALSRGTTSPTTPFQLAPSMSPMASQTFSEAEAPAGSAGLDATRPLSLTSAGMLPSMDATRLSSVRSGTAPRPSIDRAVVKALSKEASIEDILSGKASASLTRDSHLLSIQHYPSGSDAPSQRPAVTPTTSIVTPTASVVAPTHASPTASIASVGAASEERDSRGELREQTSQKMESEPMVPPEATAPADVEQPIDGMHKSFERTDSSYWGEHTLQRPEDVGPPSEEDFPAVETQPSSRTGSHQLTPTLTAVPSPPASPLITPKDETCVERQRSLSAETAPPAAAEPSKVPAPPDADTTEAEEKNKDGGAGGEEEKKKKKKKKKKHDKKKKHASDSIEDRPRPLRNLVDKQLKEGFTATVYIVQSKTNAQSTLSTIKYDYDADRLIIVTPNNEWNIDASRVVAEEIPSLPGAPILLKLTVKGKESSAVVIQSTCERNLNVLGGTVGWASAAGIGSSQKKKPALDSAEHSADFGLSESGSRKSRKDGRSHSQDDGDGADSKSRRHHKKSDKKRKKSTSEAADEPPEAGEEPPATQEEPNGAFAVQAS
ncbi:uncharacterized protein BcabD6B2_00950 [Babesia caballi]|uniref:Uncharacterized protein n=1 Tax=Babesia caballi TaxID=5871 RepID=A0AAV4LML5_BABCB|nr:hypothetical protein, conserved [Babesia caballi]